MKTVSWKCRFLSEEYFHKLYGSFIEAFSDYVIPFALTETQFRNHINLNAVDLARTVGCVDGDRLVGFSLNGFGQWNGKRTVYDAGTGVISAFRRQGISEAMFEMMLPTFKDDGIEQSLLEVIETNAAAINLYQKLGYESVRELALLQCDGKLKTSVEKPHDVEILEIDTPDWKFLTSFWDGKSSWQNSVDAVNRSRKIKRVLGAYLDGKCVGYVVFSSNFGRVAQLAVGKDHRNRGIGTALMLAVQNMTVDGFSIQIINVDKSITSAMNFFRNRGFSTRLSQFEMIKPI